MHHLFILFCCLQICAATFLEAGSTALCIEAEEVEYNGDEILLKGDVTIEHALGKISARRFTITKNNENKKFFFSKLFIEDQVTIDLESGGHLTCARAEINYDKLYAICTNTLEEPWVVFTSQHHPISMKSKSLLTIKGETLQIWFVKSQSIEIPQSPQTQIEQLQMDGNVLVKYGEHLMIYADRAIYQADALLMKSQKSGKILLSALPDAFCLIKTVQGDEILAKKIILDTNNQQVELIDVAGTLLMQNSPKLVKFSTDKLIWNEGINKMLLIGNVSIQGDSSFKIYTKNELQIIYIIKEGEKVLETFFSPQETEMWYADELTQTERKLTCPGALLIDHKILQIEMDSPKEELEKPLHHQIQFEDSTGKLRADNMKINYHLKNNKLFSPEKIMLNGHVKMQRYYKKLNEKKDPTLQYALADQVEYYPEKQEIILNSTQEGQVLFYDPLNSMQISAPSLNIHYDKTKHCESIQGNGHVRFTFFEREINQLNEHFDFAEIKR